MKSINMKNIVLMISVVLLSGCDFLDCSESAFYEKEDLQSSYFRTKQMVTNIYGYLPAGFCNIDGGMHDAATDDAVHVYESDDIQRFVNGTWAPGHVVDNLFENYYKGIYDANLYLEEFKNLTFDEWTLNDNYQNWLKDFKNYEFEVRFLRAYYYFELTKRFQNIPLVLKVLSMEEANNAVPESADKILDFIISECEAVSKELPITYAAFADKETGRITKGTALALCSRATLYKASPLYSTTDNTDKWKAAAKAAYDLIGQADALGYALDNSYANLFGTTNNLSKEVILARPNGTDNVFESANFPMGVNGGRTSTCPTENLVSAYEMTDGSAFDWNNPTMKANPYANRDPRLAQTVAYNGMNWPYKVPVEIWEGGVNGLPLANATNTGYYLKKYLNTGVNFAPGGTPIKPHHNWVLFRYAEILLNYAEAMTNAFKSPTYTDANFPLSAIEAVNKVRDRAGVKMPALPNTISLNDFVKKLKNERRVELAFEGHRFWDLRRWKDLTSVKEIYAVKVVKAASGIDYTKTLLKKYEMTDKCYFYPIADTELAKNKNLIQNPGW